MKPESGQHVKCFMRSTMVLEGLVEEWSDAQIVLKSLDGESIMIVHHPAEDIILTKIILGEEVPEVIAEAPSEELLPAQQEISDKLHNVLHPSGDLEIDNANLARLREMVHEQDKQIIVQKRKEHFGTPGSAKRAVPYSNPLGLTAYSPRPAQKSIAEKTNDQEQIILRRQFSRKK